MDFEHEGKDMDEKNVLEFKLACERYLNTRGLFSLRAYGRSLSLVDPTAKKKSELIQDIIGVLCGEFVPQRNARGAPIKSNVFEPDILETIELFKRQYLYGEIQIELKEEEVPEPVEEKIPEPPVSAEPIDRIAALTEEQRKLFNDFLNSLQVPTTP